MGHQLDVASEPAALLGSVEKSHHTTAVKELTSGSSVAEAIEKLKLPDLKVERLEVSILHSAKDTHH